MEKTCENCDHQSQYDLDPLGEHGWCHKKQKDVHQDDSCTDWTPVILSQDKEN